MPFTPSGQETDWAYSITTVPATHTCHTVTTNLPNNCFHTKHTNVVSVCAVKYFAKNVTHQRTKSNEDDVY